MSIEGRDWLLSSDWRGEDVCGVTIEGMDMAGTRIENGCSDTTGVAGGDVTGGDLTDAGASSVEDLLGMLDELSGVFEASSWLASVGASVAEVRDVSVFCSIRFESVLVLPFSAGAVVAAPATCNAGLSGLEPKSDDALDSALSCPLFTALARRSCNLELGLLRDELRDTGRGLTTRLRREFEPCPVTYLVPPPVFCLQLFYPWMFLLA